MATITDQNQNNGKNQLVSKERQEKYEEGVNYAIELNRKIANIIVLLLFLLVPGILHILLEERTLKRRILKAGPMILNTMALIKYTVMLSREQKIRNCLGLMELDWKVMAAGGEEVNSLMRENANVGRRLTRVCAVTFYMGGLSYRLIKTLLTPNLTTPSGLVVKPLPSPLYDGGFGNYNYSTTPIYELIFAVQMMAGFAVHSTTITTCSYAAVLATHACGQFDIVVLFLNKLITVPGDQNTAGKLRTVIQQHLKVLSFVGDVEDLLHEICLVEIVGGTMILCLTVYYFIMDWEKNDALGILTYTVMITSLVALLFTYCYIGELVSEKAKNVGSSSYMINWYELSPKTESCIGLIISVSRDPMKLTAGKMFELSMHNFRTIMRTAASYLNLLRTVTD